MTSQPPERDEVLRRLMAGDLDPNAEEARSMFKDDPALLARFEGLSSLANRLDEAAREERRLLQQEQEPEALSQVQGALDQLWESESVDSHSKDEVQGTGAGRILRSGWIRFASVAAAGLLLWLGLREGQVDEPHDDPRESIQLHGSSLSGLVPEGEVESFGEFQWSYELVRGATFSLIVRDANDGSVLVRERRLKTQSWSPPQELAKEWTHIRWTVQVQLPGSDDPLIEKHAVARLKN